MSPASVRGSVRPPAEQVSTQQFAEDVAFYLTQTPRQLPSRYLYDALGSALFEAITRLPWYRLTRAETGLLTAHARAILAACAPLSDTLELGAGSGEKLAQLLQARDSGSDALRGHLVDVSRSALSAAAGLLVGLPATQVITHEATYEAGLAEFRRNQAGAGRTLLLFLGSNMGNFDPPKANELLRQIRSALQPGDLFLLGADLLKPERELMLAYADPLGVTAAFNRNLLVRINRELGADFDLDSFQHRALWNATESRMESYLVSTRTQRVRIPEGRLELSLHDGETIWTESSYKYSLEGLFSSLQAADFARRQAWVDEDAQFALILVQR